MERDGWIIRNSLLEPVEEMLDDERLGKLLRALSSHFRGVETVPEDPLVRMAYSFLSRKMDEDAARYEEAKGKRVEAARKGAEARWMRKDADASDGMRKDAIYVYDNVNVYDTLSVYVYASGDAEKDRVFEKFFFLNYKEPGAEVARFYAWGEANGWRKSSGQPIKNRVAYASFWKPKADGNVFPYVGMAMLAKVFEAARKAADPEAPAVFLVQGMKLDQEALTVTAPKKTVDLVERYVRPAWLQGRKLIYAMTTKNQQKTQRQ